MERWKHIPGYDGYEASDAGRIRRADGGIVASTIKPRTGYEQVSLSTPSGRKTRLVHRLVLLAFVGVPAPGQEGRHMNGVGSDNRLTNLAWGTKRENAADRDRHGRTYRGEAHPNAIATRAMVIEIRALQMIGLTLGELSRHFGLSVPAVQAIATYRLWRQVP